MGLLSSFLFLVFLLPVIGFIFLLRYVIKKSTAKKSPEFHVSEKMRMGEKVNKLKKELKERNQFAVTDISNNLSHSWFKGFTRTMTGHILTVDNMPIIAFQRIERGIMNDCKILAASAAFEIYYELKGVENSIFFNNVPLGKIDSQYNIRNTNGQIIGSANRKKILSDTKHFKVVLHDEHIADIAQCFDMRTIERNPLYHVSRTESKNNRKYIVTDFKQIYQVVQPKKTLKDDEMEWVTAIGVFESIYYTLDFV